MRTSGIEALGQQIERLAKESKNWEISYEKEMEARSEATSDKIIAERERDDARVALVELAKDVEYKSACLVQLETARALAVEERDQLAKKSVIPKVGTWAWACEMAFENPGKRYNRGDSVFMDMLVDRGGLRNSAGEPFNVSVGDLSATDWREVTP